MKLFRIPGVNLPEIYLAEDKKQARFAREHGLPWIRLPNGWSVELLAKVLLYNWLCREFPAINWDLELGIGNPVMKIKIATEIMVNVPHTRDVGDGIDGGITGGMEVTEGGYRETTDGGFKDDVDFGEVDLMQYVGTEWEHDVNLAGLQSIGIMPTFVSDIATAIRKNLMSVNWVDGWNKKLGAPIGKPGYASQAPNLMVLDVSGSIPGGVALTMVKLIDTLREQANADLIITGKRSWWYPIGSELPSPERLAGMIGGANEVIEFQRILEDHVYGKHWGNLVVFGDDDAPSDWRFRGSGDPNERDAAKKSDDIMSSGTTFDNVLAFHTRCDGILPGYGRFARLASPNVPIQYSYDWIKSVRRNYKRGFI